MVRTGIMGGTFDPIHFGHLDCARTAQRVLSLDEVLFIPAACTAFKQERELAPAADRLAMCECALGGRPGWSLSDLEIARGGTTYTLDTLRELRGARPSDVFYFLSGSDALASLDRWHGAPELGALAVFVAVERPGYGMPAERRAELAAKGFEIVCIDNEGYDISSSQIRRMVRSGASIDDLVPAAVAAYIDEHGLYVRR